MASNIQLFKESTAPLDKTKKPTTKTTNKKDTSTQNTSSRGNIPPYVYIPEPNITIPDNDSKKPEMTEEEKAAAEADKLAAEEAERIAAEQAAAADLEARTFGLPTNRELGRPNYNYTDVPTPNRGPRQNWQGMDMYNALLALQTQYNQNMAGAKPKTEAEIQQQAGADYAAYYDQLRRAAANQYALQDLSYLQQRQGIQNSYDKNREASARNYAQNYSQADRQLLARGMQRSSYGAQTLANIARQGAEAQQAIWDQQIQSEGNVDAMRQQLLANYANTQQGYDAGQASDILSRIWGLRDTEYDRQVNRANTLNQLATQLYGYLNGINETGREQFNTEATLRENQHQFDTNVAETRQGVLDTRVNNQMDNDLKWAQLQEQAYQYANSANWDEAKYRFENPGYAYTRANDGRLVMNTAPNSGGEGGGYSGGYSGPNIVVNYGGGAAANGTTTVGSQNSVRNANIAKGLQPGAASTTNDAVVQGSKFFSNAVDNAKLSAFIGKVGK